jgi:Mce-associated membrane protein
MPSPERPSEALDADHGDEPLDGAGSDVSQSLSGTTADAQDSLEEAETAAAEAQARAEAARAHAIRLRRQAEDARGGDQREDDAAEAQDSGDEAVAEEVREDAGNEAARSPRSRRRWLPRPGWKAVSVGAAVILIGASLAASGYMAWHHRTALQERQRAAEFSAAARQGVVTLMSIDASKAREDIQRVIDNSTGKFNEDLRATADDLIKTVEQSKISSKVTVEAVAVESMTDNSAVVLVAAKSELTKPDNTKGPPALWRISVTLKTDGGQLKMSKVEFVQ